MTRINIRNKKGQFIKGYIKSPVSLETREKMRQAQLKNPTNYWLGKKRKMPWFDGKRGTSKNNYFRHHKFIGKDHVNWKGDEVGYYALHSWVVRNLGQPTMCEFCGKNKLKGNKIHWANKSHKYKRDMNDWIRLCAKCHWHYDRKGIYA